MSRIALYAGGGAPYNHAAILARAGHEIEFVYAADIVAGALDGVDVFVMPGGGYRAMAGQLVPLGAEGCRRIADWVRAGGMYLGSCAGSYDAAITPPAFLDACPMQSELRLVSARVWNDGASTLGVIQSPGIGELVAEVADAAHPVMAGMPSTFRITHYNGPLFVGGSALATVTGTTDAFTPAEHFLADGPDELLIDRGVEERVSNIVAEEVGEGRVVLFGSHPEFGATLTLDDLAPASSMLLNAVAWQAASRPEVAIAGPPLVTRAPVDAEVRRVDLADLADRAASIRERAAALQRRTAAGAPPWLGADQAMAMLGRSGREVWDAALRSIPDLVDEAVAAAPELPEHVLSFRPPAEWDVDGGFWGVAPLLEQIDGLLAEADARWDESFPAADGYDHMRDSPYHLVAGSYLAAVGRAAAAALLARAFAPALAR
jgi:hypothetical protein